MTQRNQQFIKKISLSLASASYLFTHLAGIAQADSVFGEIEAPDGVKAYNAKTISGIGILPFVTTLIRLATIVAGIWVMFNFITAGWMYITGAGDSSTGGKVSSKLTMSIVGLLLIVAAYTITGIISYIMFGDATYVLNPKFEGV